MSLLVIGDIHGEYDKYKKIIFTAAKMYIRTLQLGDMGFDYRFFGKYDIDPNFHKFFGGNHDNYDIIESYISNIGDWGMTNHGDINFWFIRGGFSIDKQVRTPGRDWWLKEELSYKEMCECLQTYKKYKPEIVITHEAPCFLSKILGDREILQSWGYDPDIFCSNTGKLLQACFDTHKPRLWIHGHLHKSNRMVRDGTSFISLAPFETFLIEKNLDD